MLNRGFLNASTGSKFATAAIAAGLSLWPTIQAEAAAQHGYKILYNFQRQTDGGEPTTALTVDSNNNLYGTTLYGGNLADCNGYGCGVVFKLSKGGNYTVLYAFNGSDGKQPDSQLLLADNGDLYGTTVYGGAYQEGNVFKLTRSGKETVLYSFTGKADGGDPNQGNSGNGPLVRDAAGNLYGTTSFGGDLNCNSGTGCGVVYKVSKTGEETVLHTFEGTDGAYPVAGLLADSAGDLYGTTTSGGNLSDCNGAGCGVVFKIDGAGNESTLYSFTGAADGRDPEANLIQDAQGNFYSTTIGGGVGGEGVVFKLTQSGQDSVLYSFYGDQDGGYPESGVLTDANGNLYGTTSQGGRKTSGGGVFKVDTTGKETLLHSFGHADGTTPDAGLVWGINGKLYGTTDLGGSGGWGTVFEIAP